MGACAGQAESTGTPVDHLNLLDNASVGKLLSNFKHFAYAKCFFRLRQLLPFDENKYPKTIFNSIKKGGLQ